MTTSIKATDSEDFKGKSTSSDPEKRKQADLIYLVRGIDDNRNAWYYVLIERKKVSAFLEALNDDIIHLEEFGIVLYSAYGDDPSKEVTDSIHEEYGI